MIEAGMAVIPHRFINLKQSIPGILKQVDKLYIHINKYKGETPSILNNDKIVLSTSRENKNAFMKMKGMSSSEADYFFTMDDDILYPEDYVEKMVQEANNFGGYSVISVHGGRFNPNKKMIGFVNRRKMYSFWDAQKKTVQIMMPGNGTCCYPRRTFLDLESFNEGLHKYSDIDDVYMMCWIHKNGFRIHTVKRGKGWLKQLPPRGSSLQHFRPVKKMEKLAVEYTASLQEVWNEINNTD